jgi:hypothetical protein
MTRINAIRNTAANNSVAWGKEVWTKETWTKNTGALVFAGVLILCSITVGCSSDKPKPVNSTPQIPATQAHTPAVPAPVMQAESKPAPKKVVHKKPATVNYTDKTTGLTFEYPRRYAIETGNAATELLLSSPVPMNFVQSGGIALAAVELPETSFANTDFSSAFFDVSVNKTLSADQCNQFALPQPKVATPVQSADSVSTSTASATATTAPSTSSPSAEAKPATEQAATAQPTATADQSTAKSTTEATSTQQPELPGSKLFIGDLELRATEAVSGEGTRQSDSKYFHVYQNGACYEFALNVTTVASEDGVIKHVDRDKVFSRLEQILSTVKISPVAAPEVAAETPTTPAPTETPAQ